MRWVIWDRLFSQPAFSVNPACAEFEMPTIAERKMLFEVRRQAALALSQDGLDLYRTNDADPLAFISGPGKTPLDVRFDMRGATVDAAAAPAGSAIVVNVL